MNENMNLTTGSITHKLIYLAVPIIGTSFIQMAYNLTDMFWLGKYGSMAVASVGTAGFYTWLAASFILLTKIGVEVKVSQNIGSGKLESVKKYIVSGLQMTSVLALLYGLVMILFKDQLIGFFVLGNKEMLHMGTTYLQIVSMGMLFYFLNPVFTGIFNGLGDSKTPFWINTVGLVFNIVVDPILIMGLFGAPELGVAGAAIATVMAQLVVTLCFIVVIMKRKYSYVSLNVWCRVEWGIVKKLVTIGLPAALQGGLFTIFSMGIGRIVAGFGEVAMAVQQVGQQVEAISWQTASGLSTAIGTFTGQNYGAKAKDRMDEGYKITMKLAVGLGVFATLLLVFGGEMIFSVFLPQDPLAIEEGRIYLFILGLSQLFMCIEITSAGFFNGLGKTYIPSIIGIVFTGARIPLAILLASPYVLGLQGVWWSITISSIVKGILIVMVYMYFKKKNKLYNI